MRLTINRIEHDLSSPPLTSLLHVLREDIGITSPKAGCQQGGCGACTVLVNGEPVRACLTPLALVEGADVTTLEGLGDLSSLSPLQAAFHESYAAQCGFCTSGMILAAHGLLERSRNVTREDVLGALGGHVCRCTGYVKIVDAVLAAASGRVGAEGADFEPRADEPEVAVTGAPA
jgi:aerobic-type carbon monoxide dehydrogenase small subunit (CoxS/CutS family)